MLAISLCVLIGEALKIVSRNIRQERNLGILLESWELASVTEKILDFAHGSITPPPAPSVTLLLEIAYLSVNIRAIMETDNECLQNCQCTF